MGRIDGVVIVTIYKGLLVERKENLYCIYIIDLVSSPFDVIHVRLLQGGDDESLRSIIQFASTGALLGKEIP